MSDRIARMAIMAHTWQQNLPQRCPDENVNCRLHRGIDQRADALAALMMGTEIQWYFFAGADIGVRIGTRLRHVNDCQCLLFAARQHLNDLLCRDTETEHARDIVENVEDCIRVAIGPGRVALIEIVATTRPEWIPRRRA
jgi:hypothetical protein